MAGLYRGGGTIGIIGAARVGLLAHKDNDDETGQRRLLMVQKCNIGPEATTLVYQIVGIEGTDSSRVEWLGESPVTADRIMGQSTDRVEREDASDAELWLEDLLEAGPVRSTEVFREATKAGYSAKVIKGAKSSLKVRSLKDGYGKEGGWSWAMPEYRRTPNYANVAKASTMDGSDL